MFETIASKIELMSQILEINDDLPHESRGNWTIEKQTGENLALAPPCVWIPVL